MDSQNNTRVADQDEREPFTDQIELLALMGRDFAATLDLEKTLLKTLEHITMYMDAASGAMFLLDDSGKHLRCHVCIGETDITGLVLDSDHGIVGRSVQSNTGELIHNVADDPDFTGAVDQQTGFVTRSILCAPMSVQDQKIGAIELINRRSGDGCFVKSDLDMLQAMASSAAMAILNARMAESLVEQERVRRELELAAEIQRTLLPTPQNEPFPVHGVNRPARMVSGDFFDFFSLSDGRICFNIGDVSGKGMNAALMMAKTTSLYRCLGKSINDPGRLLSKINEEICETASRGMFVTMIGGIYDPRTGVVRIANAGHEPALYHKPDDNFAALKAEVPPLGIVPELASGEPCPEIELQLKGGALYLFTDGVTEGYLESGDMFGVDGFKELILSSSDLSPSSRLKAVTNLFNNDDSVLRDDLTILVIDDAVPLSTRTSQGIDDTPVSAETYISRETILKLQFPAKPDRLKLVRGAVAETAKLCGCSKDVSEGIIIAIDEACQNIIRHAYGDDEDGEIILEIRRRANNIIIFLRDFAETIDVSMVKPRQLDDIRPGGLGTHFMLEIMDEVIFMPPPADGGNILRMTKHIS